MTIGWCVCRLLKWSKERREKREREREKDEGGERREERGKEEWREKGVKSRTNLRGVVRMIGVYFLRKFSFFLICHCVVSVFVRRCCFCVAL